MNKKTYGLTLILALLLSTVGPLLVGLVAANPLAFLPAITIKSDGSVEPQTSFIRQDGNVYTLTGDLVQTYTIRIQCSNIVFDGGGHTIDGMSPKGYGYSVKGLSVEDVRNVTIKNLEVRGFTDRDVSLQSTTNSTVLNIKAGILQLEDSDFNTISRINLNRTDPFVPLLELHHSDSNTFTECSLADIYLIYSYGNNFFKNNIFVQYLSNVLVVAPNFWDDGSVGNYWSNYNGTDVNCDGLGDIPYTIKWGYSNDSSQDRFPLMYPWDPTKPIDRTPPSIDVSSPQNKVYNDSSVALAFLVCEPVSWMGYSLNGQDNITVTGNTTLSGLGNGAYNLTVYATDLAGNTGASETCSFTVSAPFPIAPVAAIFGLAIGAATVCLLFNKRRSTAKLKSIKNES